MNINIIKSKKYKNILCRCLKVSEELLELPDYSDIPDLLFEDFVVHNDIDYSIFLKTEFIFFIDGVFIGVFDNKYIVSMRESDLSFEIVGDTESNWIEAAFGWGFQLSDLFMAECFKEFGIPIKKFNEIYFNEKDFYNEQKDININILKNEKYQKNLCEKLNLNILEIQLNNHSDLNLLFENSLNHCFDIYPYNKNIFFKTQFIFFIHDLYIGVFNKKYIVALNIKELQFRFIGDSESNWLERAFNIDNFICKEFMQKCFLDFGIPIKQYRIPIK